MKLFKNGLTVIVFALSLVSAAQADTGGWYVAPAIVHTNDDGDRLLDDDIGGGQVAVGYDLSDDFMIEGMIGSSSLDGWYQGTGESHLDISANLLTFADREAAFAGYLLLGLGYLSVDYDGGGSENRASATGGLGFIWSFGDSPVSLRGEYRVRFAFERDRSLNDVLASLGVQVAFGEAQRKRKSRKLVDSDFDGITDDLDQCPDTRRGLTVDGSGCLPDGDNDGIADVGDKCRNTAMGVSVDNSGCPTSGGR